MNYVSVLMVGVALFAIIYWYAAGRYYYIGPRVKAQLIMGVEGETGGLGGERGYEGTGGLKAAELETKGQGGNRNENESSSSGDKM